MAPGRARWWCASSARRGPERSSSRAPSTPAGRAAGPFVAINCAAIPESLLEAELFGAERGAFTGATQLRRGCFEQAGGGTLFLDELGEMSLATQARMLRVLQERTIRRLGGFEDIPVDIRIVCATRRDLGLGVRCGWFREDLYYRLVVYPIEMPALRDRRGDVPLLVEHMLGRLQQGRAQRVRWIRPEALDALERYPWPGNVRELLNVLQRALLTCEGDEIALTDLPFQIRGLAAPAPSRMRVEPDAGATIVDEVTPLEALERQAIEHALAASAGRVGKAAALLGVARSTLYRRIAAAKIPYRR
ncbi:MAG: sigma 54-interacting transcriptional regulator [Byssovorax sp.]